MVLRRPRSALPPPTGNIGAVSNLNITATAANHSQDHSIDPFALSESQPANRASQTPQTPHPITNPDPPEDGRVRIAATQVVASRVAFSESMLEEAVDNGLASSMGGEPRTSLAGATASFPGVSLRRLGNISSSSLLIVEGEATQVVPSGGYPISEGMLAARANVHPLPANVEELETQVVASGAPFSHGMLQSLENADLGNIQVSPTVADDDGDYDELSTIREESVVAESDIGDNQEPEAAPSVHKSLKSWASGSLTTSMREIIGLRPKPLSHGRVRPVPEDLGPPPAPWPCRITITHHTCGHNYKHTEHSHLCGYDNEPSERVIRQASKEGREDPEINEGGLPPSAQPPAGAERIVRLPCTATYSKMVLGPTECKGCMPGPPSPNSNRVTEEASRTAREIQDYIWGRK